MKASHCTADEVAWRRQGLQALGLGFKVFSIPTDDIVEILWLQEAQ